MGKGSNSPLEVEVLTRQFASFRTATGWRSPVADPSRVSYGTETGCLEEQRLFLGEYFADLPATELGAVQSAA